MKANLEIIGKSSSSCDNNFIIIDSINQVIWSLLIAYPTLITIVVDTIDTIYRWLYSEKKLDLYMILSLTQYSNPVLLSSTNYNYEYMKSH